MRAAVGGLEDVRCVVVGGPDGWRRCFVRQEGRRAVKVVAERVFGVAPVDGTV